jgi:hypothetical protein
MLIPQLGLPQDSCSLYEVFYLSLVKGIIRKMGSSGGAGMSTHKYFPLLLLGLLLLLTNLLVACARSSTHISVSPDQITFVAPAGDNALSENIEIYSSATTEPLS